jgi:hypothetical protein
MHDPAGPETVAEHKYTFKACFGEKPDRCFDFLTGIGKYSFAGDLTGASEPGIDGQGVDAALGKRMGQQTGGPASKKMP